MNARKLITIEGEQRPYDLGTWVFYDRQGYPYGCMLANARSGDDPVKAAREFWGTSSEAMKFLTEGHRLELMLHERWKREICPLMISGVRKRAQAAASSGETR